MYTYTPLICMYTFHTYIYTYICTYIYVRHPQSAKELLGIPPWQTGSICQGATWQTPSICQGATWHTSLADRVNLSRSYLADTLYLPRSYLAYLLGRQGSNLYVNIGIYIYIHIYTYIYIYRYIYIHTHVYSSQSMTCRFPFDLVRKNPVYAADGRELVAIAVGAGCRAGCLRKTALRHTLILENT